jgi:hypothetical protein
MESLDLDAVQDFGIELRDLFLFLKLLLWVKLGTPNLESCLHHDLWVELHHLFIMFLTLFIEVNWIFCYDIWWWFDIVQIVHKAFDMRRLESWFGTQIIHLSTHISFCQIEMTNVKQYSILWI